MAATRSTWRESCRGVRKRGQGGCGGEASPPQERWQGILAKCHTFEWHLSTTYYMTYLKWLDSILSKKKEKKKPKKKGGKKKGEKKGKEIYTHKEIYTRWFVSTSTNSMRCFVNWIPLNTHVCFKKPQPWGFVKHAATNVWGAKGKTRPFREILVHRKGRGKAKGGYMKKRRNESPANYKSWIYFVSKNIMRWNLYLHRFAQASYIYTCSTQVTAPGLSP